MICIFFIFVIVVVMVVVIIVFVGVVDFDMVCIIILVVFILFVVDCVVYDLVEQVFVFEIVIDYILFWGGELVMMMLVVLMDVWCGIVLGFDVIWYFLGLVSVWIDGDFVIVIVEVDGWYWIDDCQWWFIGVYYWDIVCFDGDWCVIWMEFVLIEEIGDWVFVSEVMECVVQSKI